MARRETAGGRSKTSRHSGALGILIAALALVLAALAGTSPAYATACAPDASRRCQLTVNCFSGGDAIENARIELYRVADYEPGGTLTLTESFEDSGVNLYEPTLASEWLATARSLELYVKRNEVSPTVVTVTSPQGTATLTNLPCGYYLVPAAKGYDDTGASYISSAFLISLPEHDEFSETWSYRVTVAPKFEMANDGHDRNHADGSEDSDGSNGGKNVQGEDEDASGSSRYGRGGLAGTGDFSPTAAAAGIALIGIALMAAARLREMRD